MTCECGSDRFFASQKCWHSIIVDGFGNFEEDVCVEEADESYGPFVCTKCGKEYEELT